MSEQTPLWTDARWIVATFFALWGAGLSTYQQIASVLQRRAKAKVSLEKSLVGLPLWTPDAEDRLESALSITIRNLGQVDLTFEGLCCALEVKGHTASRIVLHPRYCEPVLPTTIKHGQSLKMVAMVAGLRDAVREINQGRLGPLSLRVNAADAIGRRFLSAWTELTFPEQSL